MEMDCMEGSKQQGTDAKPEASIPLDVFERDSTVDRLMGAFSLSGHSNFALYPVDERRETEGKNS
jgi:hypothetical protein